MNSFSGGTADADFDDRSLTAQRLTTQTMNPIVLVEDLEDNREMLRTILELDGHHVITAADGESGYDAICEHKPKVALIDIGLPGIDGFEVARRVRRSVGCEAVRLIALTGYGQPSDVAKAMEAGFDAHMVKPVNPASLSEMLR